MSDLEKELKEWRESRRSDRAAATAQVTKAFSSSNERRTLRVNGQEVLVISKNKKSLS